MVLYFDQFDSSASNFLFTYDVQRKIQDCVITCAAEADLNKH